MHLQRGARRLLFRGFAAFSTPKSGAKTLLNTISIVINNYAYSLSRAVRDVKQWFFKSLSWRLGNVQGTLGFDPLERVADEAGLGGVVFLALAFQIYPRKSLSLRLPSAIRLRVSPGGRQENDRMEQ